MVGELSQEFLRSQRAAKLAEKMCQGKLMQFVDPDRIEQSDRVQAASFATELRRLASIRRFLTSTATATLVSAFVLSRVDYCNSLLFGSTHNVAFNLQQIQNYAARVMMRLPKSTNITTHIKSLHCFPVKVRSIFKIACLCCHCHSSTAPSYVTDMLQKMPSHTNNTRSSSYTMSLLNRPAHIKAALGDRSFSFASSVCTSIPNDVRCAPSLSSCMSRLKTWMFRRSRRLLSKLPNRGWPLRGWKTRPTEEDGQIGTNHSLPLE